MSNTWFRFKKFMVRQDRTAMKVGTDGVLLGAWADTSCCNKILDIGTGTGLIALMLAQRSEGSHIDAIEIDPGAAGQAVENVSASPWAGRINVIQLSLKEFRNSSRGKYDLIACNPPYFRNSLKAGSLERTLARHAGDLGSNELLDAAAELLNPEGKLCVILPSVYEDEFLSVAETFNLFPAKIVRIKPNPGSTHNRVLLELSFSVKAAAISEMSIETGTRHEYSREYARLTREYYL